MSRVVFQLSGTAFAGAQTGVSISLEEPADFEALDQPFELPNDVAEFIPQSVKERGLALYTALQAHPRLSAHLGAALLSADPRFPVYVEIGPGSGVEGLAWEALCTPDGTYLALDKKIALARMVRTQAPDVPVHELAAPIKIVAVLSCQGETGASELAAIRAAAQAVGPDLVRILLLSGEEELIATALADMAAGTAPELEAAELIPNTADDFGKRITDFDPHVLHFFCHGSATPTPRLQIALKDDFIPGAQASGLKLEASQFVEFGSTGKTSDRPWLVVLNCCEGGAADPTSTARSLALDLTFSGVAAAVIGMREPVTPIVATMLTTKLYQALLRDLADRLTDQNPRVAALDWARIAVDARSSLATDLHTDLSRSQAAATTKEWTLPVVYLSPDPFWVQANPAAPWPAPGEAIAPGVPGDPGGFVAPGAPGVPGTPGEESMETRTKRLEFTAILQALAAMQEGQGEEFLVRAHDRLTLLAAELGVDLPPGAFGVGQ